MVASAKAMINTLSIVAPQVLRDGLLAGGIYKGPAKPTRSRWRLWRVRRVSAQGTPCTHRFGSYAAK